MRQPGAPLRPTCRASGTLLIARPEPSVVGRPPAASRAPAEEQFFAPAVLQPIVRLPPSSSERGPARVRRAVRYRVGGDGESGSCSAGWCSCSSAAIATGGFTWAGAKRRPRRPSCSPRAPRRRTPVGPRHGRAHGGGIGAPHRAADGQETGNGDPAQLRGAARLQVGHGRPSVDRLAHRLGRAGPGVVTVAVAASNHDVCAFGRWSRRDDPCT